MLSSHWEKLALFFLLNCAFCVQVWSKKEPCTDYPSCQLISEKMFENYCSRSTLKNMCPTHCDKSCQPQYQQQQQQQQQQATEDNSSRQQQLSDEDDTSKVTSSSSTGTDETDQQTNPPVSTSVTMAEHVVGSSEDEEDEELGAIELTTTTTTTTTTKTTPTLSQPNGMPMNRKKFNKHRRPGYSGKKTTATTTSTTQATTTTTSSDLTSVTSDEDESGDEYSESSTTSVTSKWPSTVVNSGSSSSKFSQKFVKQHTTTRPLLHTEVPDSSSETTRKVPSNLPNGTIYVPLFEAGFVQRVIPTSSKEGYDFSKAKVCKKLDDCAAANVWCPMSNDIPKEQVEILLNYTTDIYMLETQGAVFSNETVTSFLFQYLNEAGMLVSRLFRTDTSNSTEINKFKFEPPFRTNYIRITPIDFFKSIVFRFEIYSKGILYNPSSE